MAQPPKPCLSGGHDEEAQDAGEAEVLSSIDKHVFWERCKKKRAPTRRVQLIGSSSALPEMSRDDGRQASTVLVP